jgi:pantetheine-phosphate adenylyltransferase
VTEFPASGERIALYAGSFDPITHGHEDLIQRTFAFADRLVVAVANNLAKQPLFTVDERIGYIREVTGNDPRIVIRAFDGLLVDFAREVGARVNVRGLRAVSDFEYEFQMALMNRHLHPTLETVFMAPSFDTTYISSSMVREVARFGGDVTQLVHPCVAKALRERFARGPS